MVEQVFQMTFGDEKKIERLIMDENINYVHAIFTPGEEVAPHFSDAQIYMTILRGNITLGLDELPANVYGPYTVLKIPKGTKMDLRNLHADPLELIIVKTHK